ncbi:MAG TPA: hypothetical protein VM282_19370 [Acidimicrobiales bacterium]|nr:hypothetical protein [Acidimicrobiales bacterium]
MTSRSPSLPDKIVALHRALEAARVGHAFGGALALAWCTRRPRGTSDIDINIFAPPAQARRVLRALPSEVRWADDDRDRLRRDGQVRLWWDTTPVDLFLSTTSFHRRASRRVRFEPFRDDTLPFLACDDLAVFKVFFDRSRDWADLEEMTAASSFDAGAVRATIAALLDAHDARLTRLADLLERADRVDANRPEPRFEIPRRTRQRGN